jgi:hypothetical protein
MFCIGENHQIMYNEPATCVPLAIFKADLQPHIFFPISLAEDAAQDQDTQTAILRSIIDNVALVNSPRTLANDALVNIEDLKNTAIAAIVRTKNMDAVKDLVTPFVAGETLPILQFLREIGESRTGVTKLSQGLDPNALQAVSRIAANAATQGSDSRIEMMARNLAETGVKSLFIAILRVAMYELKGQVQINTPSGFKTIDPSVWHDQVNVVATVGMGNGKIEEKMGTLNTVLQFQQQALKDYGPSSPFMTWDNVRYTIKSMLRLSGLKNVQDYLPLPNPEDVQKWQADQDRKQQEAQKNNPPPPPAPDVVGAAKVKAEADTKMNDAKIQAQTQADLQKMSAAQQNLMAQLQQKHELEMADLQITLQKEMAIAQMQVDAKRDADNQNFAVKSQQVHLDAQQKAQVLQQNAMNNIVNGQKRTVQ